MKDSSRIVADQEEKMRRGDDEDEALQDRTITLTYMPSPSLHVLVHGACKGAGSRIPAVTQGHGGWIWG